MSITICLISAVPCRNLWVESTSPGLMWEELSKSYENGSKALWVVNVGDIKPAELAIDFYAQLAWNPDQFGPDAQAVFLKKFTADVFGEKAAHDRGRFRIGLSETRRGEKARIHH